MNKFITIFCALLTIGYAQIRIEDTASFRFLTTKQGRELLTKSDDFIQRLSPFDRAARLKTDEEVSEEVFLQFVSRNVLDWTEGEKNAVESTLADLKPRLESLFLPWPETICLVKTTGSEEGHAAYTRGNAIVFPKDKLLAKKESLQKLICHELFHILTRNNPILQDKLYEAIGFYKCNEIAVPSEVNSRKITNPDAPRNDHCIRLRISDRSVWAIPVLVSQVEKYNRNKGGEFFESLRLQFLLVERKNGSVPLSVTYDDKTLSLVNIEGISGLFEQIGKNTEYIIHPEEILADNFTLLVLGVEHVPSPEILKKMNRILTEAQRRRR